MQAVAVRPGEPYSAHLVELERPTPGPHEALVRVHEVGLDATDYTINAGEHAEAPEGADFLVIGHESIGQVEAVGEGVAHLAPGMWVTGTVRRPDGCPPCRHGSYDMCLWGEYRERGIKGYHGYLAEFYVEKEEFLVPVPDSLIPIGSLIEPFSIVEKAIQQSYAIQRRLWWLPRRAAVLGAGQIGLFASYLLRLKGLDVTLLSREGGDSPEARLVERTGAHYRSTEDTPLQAVAAAEGAFDLIIEATGYSPLAFEAVETLNENGVLCLLSVTGGERCIELNSAQLNNQLVLGNRLIFGSVNSNRGHFEEAIRSMQQLQQRWPGVLEEIISIRVPGLAHIGQALASSEEAAQGIRDKEWIKAVVTLGPHLAL